MIKCANRVHGWPPHVYHRTLEDVRACCAGRSVPNLAEDGSGEILERSRGLLGRRGPAYRERIRLLWLAEVLEHEYFDGDVDVARAAKIRFYRRCWIRCRDVDLENLW